MPGPNPLQPQHSDTPGADAAPSEGALPPMSMQMPMIQNPTPSSPSIDSPPLNANASVIVSRREYDWMLRTLAQHGESLPSTTSPAAPTAPAIANVETAAAAPAPSAASALHVVPVPPMAPALPAPPAEVSPPALPASSTALSAPADTMGQPVPTSLDFATTYRIHVRGTFAKDGEHVLIVSTGSRDVRITLNLVEFLTLLILASFARKGAGFTAPVDIRGSEYLKPDRIFKAILKLKRSEPDLEGQAENLDIQDVYDARYGIRVRLRNARLEQDLFESLKGSGYRISTLPAWIKITLFDDESLDVWEWEA